MNYIPWSSAASSLSFFQDMFALTEYDQIYGVMLVHYNIRINLILILKHFKGIFENKNWTSLLQPRLGRHQRPRY